MTKIYLVLVTLLFVSCSKVPTKIEPELSYSISDTQLNKRSTAFPPLTEDERRESWANEYKIAYAFAKKYDLYRAISTFKRAQILIDQQHPLRSLEIQYNIVLCYYLGKKYDQAIEAFELSNLPNVDKTFFAFSDLLTILYESYLRINDTEKAERILQLMEKNVPKRAEKIKIETAIEDADFEKLRTYNISPAIKEAISCYEVNKKSPQKAKYLNAILPGAGYLYLGQKKSAFTAFLLNGLFIAAAYEFFHRGYIAAGVITTSFETGWYFGGIYGVQQETKLYNERLYERLFCPLMNREKLFPIFMLEHTF